MTDTEIQDHLSSGLFQKDIVSQSPKEVGQSHYQTAAQCGDKQSKTDVIQCQQLNISEAHTPRSEKIKVGQGQGLNAHEEDRERRSYIQNCPAKSGTVG